MTRLGVRRKTANLSPQVDSSSSTSHASTRMESFSRGRFCSTCGRVRVRSRRFGKSQAPGRLEGSPKCGVTPDWPERRLPAGGLKLEERLISRTELRPEKIARGRLSRELKLQFSPPRLMR